MRHVYSKQSEEREASGRDLPSSRWSGFTLPLDNDIQNISNISEFYGV